MADSKIIVARRKKIGKNIFLIYSERTNNGWKDIGRYKIFDLPADMPATMDKLDLSRLNWEEMPDLSSLTVKDFDCSYNKLSKLENCPKVTGHLNCSCNPNLTGFDCAAQHVGTLICMCCKSLETLTGAPTADNYIIAENKSLKNLNGMALVADEIVCKHNESLINLTGISEHIDTLVVENNPALIGLNCTCTTVKRFVLTENNALQSLNDGPKSVQQYIICNNAALISLYGAPPTVEEIVIENNPIYNLVGGPSSAAIYNLSHNPNLTSLMGCAPDVKEFIMQHCDAIETLEYAPPNAIRYICNHNLNLRSLGQIPPDPNLIDYSDCPSIMGVPRQKSRMERHEELRQAYENRDWAYILGYYGHNK